jgi:hypothetical protein
VYFDEAKAKQSSYIIHSPADADGRASEILNSFQYDIKAILILLVYNKKIYTRNLQYSDLSSVQTSIKTVRIVTSHVPSFPFSKRSIPRRHSKRHSGCMDMVCGIQLEACMTVDCSLLRLGAVPMPLQVAQLLLGFQHQRHCFGPLQWSAGTFDVGVPGQYRYYPGCTRASPREMLI